MFHGQLSPYDVWDTDLYGQTCLPPLRALQTRANSSVGQYLHAGGFLLLCPGATRPVVVRLAYSSFGVFLFGARVDKPDCVRSISDREGPFGVLGNEGGACGVRISI